MKIRKRRIDKEETMSCESCSPNTTWNRGESDLSSENISSGTTENSLVSGAVSWN